MTQQKHTQGPWTLVRHMGYDFQGNGEQNDSNNLMGFVGADGERIMWFGDSETYYPTEGTEPNEANARLIAAAPDLLGVSMMVEAWSHGLRHETAHESKMVKAARAAISKATGEEPQ